MKSYSRVFSQWILENIDKLKLASEASQQFFFSIAFLTAKDEENSEF